MHIKPNWRQFAPLMSVLLLACASPAPSVISLPQRPKPTMPAELMRPLPEPLHFRNQLSAIFGSSHEMPMK